MQYFPEYKTYHKTIMPSLSFDTAYKLDMCFFHFSFLGSIFLAAKDGGTAIQPLRVSETLSHRHKHFDTHINKFH